MNSRVIFAGMTIAILCASFALAHDGAFSEDIVSWDEIELVHYDQGPWKGYATVTVTNIMTEDWGDFHFKLNPTDVIFTEPPQGEDPIIMLLGDQNGSEYTGYSYAIGDPNAFELDFEFYSNPVEPGQQVTFMIYTDNTAVPNSFFNLCMNPTPVPEPTTMCLLGLGAALLRRRK